MLRVLLGRGISTTSTVLNRSLLCNVSSNIARYYSTEATSSAVPPQECLLERLNGEDQGISVITFNRGQLKNAIGVNMLRQFRDHLRTLKFDNQTRVVIIKSDVPGTFCAGADLKERAQMNPTQVAEFVHDIRAAFTEVETLPMPSIVSIEGIALGGGMELAISCDMRVVSKTARLGLPETGLAIIPGAGGTQRLPRIVGLARAKELIYTGEVVNSQRALDIGLVQYETEPGQAYQKSLDIARLIIPKGPVAIRMAKLAIDKGSNVDINSGMIIEQQCYAQVIPTKDRIEGLTAFREKRKPVYKGE